MMEKELKKIREDVEKIYRKKSGEPKNIGQPLSWCITDSWDYCIRFTKEEVSKSIFSAIDEAIKKTTSPVPVPIEDSNFMEELKKLKKKYWENVKKR